MAVVQEAFYIPDDITTKILTGEYRRLGGVIRVATGPNKGNIVKFLDSVEVQEVGPIKSLGVRVMQFAETNPRLIRIGGAVVAVGAVGTFIVGPIYRKWKNREPLVMKKFRAAFRTYLDEIRGGEVKLETINEMKAALYDLKHHKRYEKFRIELSAEDLDGIVGLIYDYTIKFAEDNQIDLSDRDKITTDNSILNLKNYLNIQKRIIEEAA
jgi:hypothetical protein